MCFVFLCNWGWLYFCLVLLHTLLPWFSSIRALLLLIWKTWRQKQSSVCVSTSDRTVQARAELKAVKTLITSSCPLQSSLASPALHFCTAVKFVRPVTAAVGSKCRQLRFCSKNPPLSDGSNAQGSYLSPTYISDMFSCLILHPVNLKYTYAFAKEWMYLFKVI